MPADRLAENSRPTLSLPDLLKFTALAALLAIFVDAAIGHAMMWGNDPYWTYWVTDTLLMATVFGLGTAWFGMGLVQGAVITAVHITLLTTYYWTLSPIGLPGHPEWLDLEHTWITGLPVHFAVYYLGYVVALWMWRRRAVATAAHQRSGVTTARLTVVALVLSTGIVVVLGALQTMLLGAFPGATWFVVRIAVAFPFTLAWWAMAGMDRSAAVGGGIMTAFLLTTYTHFLGPNGLPNLPLRLLAENPPPAAVQWLSYRQEFLIVLPLAAVIAVVGYMIVTRWRDGHARRWNRAWVTAAAVASLVLLGLGVATAHYTGFEANTAIVAAEGPATIEQADAGQSAATAATLSMTVENRNTHRTPLPPHDRVAIEAVIQGPEGSVYRVQATEPMVADPRGRFTTWSGVGFDVWHHGRSGIGDPAVPTTLSNVAVYALGDISVDGEPVATGVPVHVMTTSRPQARLALHVGDPDFPLPMFKDGQLRVAWADYEGGYDDAGVYARYLWGSAVLILLLGLALAAARRANIQVARAKGAANGPQHD